MAGDSDDDEGRHNTRHAKHKQERQTLFDDLAASLSKELSDSLKKSLSAELTSVLSENLTTTVKECIQSYFKDISTTVSQLEETVVSYKETLETVTAELSNLKETMATHSNQIEQLLAENEMLNKQVNEVVKQSEMKRVDDLEELIEERTNRSLRQTLVFKGVEQRGAKESWSQTKTLLSDIIAETLDINSDHAMSMINRCHRGGKQPRAGPRAIFANLFSWEDCEDIVEAFRKSNINDSTFGIYASYKYGRITTARRNEALKTRKALKASGQITKGYLAYPAKLMVQYQGETQFQEHENFSKLKITFARVES